MSGMKDRRLQVFQAVAKYGSFTRAAEHLYMTQPAVTFQIRQLEEHLNTRLFDRGHGRIALTAAGELVLGYAERILDMSAELESRVGEITGELSGTLMIGTIPAIAAYWLPEVLTSFKQRYPRVLPRLVVGNSKFIEEGVAARDLDIGLIEIISEQSGLEQRRVSHEELVVICSPTHPLARLEQIVPADLVAHPFIDRDPGSGVRLLAENIFKAAGIAPADLHVCAELGSLAAVKEMAAAGLGFAIASTRATRRDVELGRLVARPLSPRALTPIELILPRDKFRSRLITTFSDHVIAEFARHDAAAQAAGAA